MATNQNPFQKDKYYMDIEKYIINYSLKQNNYKQSFSQVLWRKETNMFKIAKKLTVIMLSASIIFSCSGIIAHAEGIKDKKQEYYQEYKRIIREANEKIGSKDFELLPIDEINEDDMLTPKEFQKAVNAAIQLDTQKPVIDDNGGEYSNESNDNMSARASGETVTESQNKKSICGW